MCCQHSYRLRGYIDCALRAYADDCNRPLSLGDCNRPLSLTDRRRWLRTPVYTYKWALTDALGCNLGALGGCGVPR